MIIKELFFKSLKDDGYKSDFKLALAPYVLLIMFFLIFRKPGPTVFGRYYLKFIFLPTLLFSIKRSRDGLIKKENKAYIVLITLNILVLVVVSLLISTILTR